MIDCLYQTIADLRWVARMRESSSKQIHFAVAEPPLQAYSMIAIGKSGYLIQCGAAG